MARKYEVLKWDSDFFNLRVCRIIEPTLRVPELKSILGLIYETGIDLAYFASKEELTGLNGTLGPFEIKLVDRKTTFVKRATNNFYSCHSIIAYQESYPEKKLLDLAIESGLYSRFYVDDKIERGKFEELYRLWIINSVNKKIAKEVFVFKEGNEIAGFVTLGEQNHRGAIGIFAVDPGFREKGIGKSLLTTAENWFANNGYDSIQIVAQGENIAACKFYENCGYAIESVEYFYHFWRN